MVGKSEPCSPSLEGSTVLAKMSEKSYVLQLLGGNMFRLKKIDSAVKITLNIDKM